MEKNRIHGYGEDKHLSTVLIAASSCDVIIDHTGIYTVWEVTLNVVKQLLIGLATGIVCGILIAFFPDKHNVDAATERILVLGLGAYAIAAVCSRFDMVAGGTLAVMITCLIASNMWEELGWHDRNNPVQYFYTMVYYYVQPVVLSLIGFSMNFHTTGFDIFIMGISVLTIGLVGREITCYVATFGKTYPTTPKEKVFICIAWFSKGTFQALLAFAIENMIHHYKSHLSESTIQSYMRYSEIIKETTVLAILLTTPLACYGMAILTPVLLNQIDMKNKEYNMSANLDVYKSVTNVPLFMRDSIQLCHENLQVIP
ncbi:hypothetical protein RUM44_006091 [Polyplax serrata]|uniref:Uncharacterized protein n=1 Tax=Polyplax serrata TaxID=468196 RepID=A0ABR1AYY2_POLSC